MPPPGTRAAQRSAASQSRIALTIIAFTAILIAGCAPTPQAGLSELDAIPMRPMRDDSHAATYDASERSGQVGNRAPDFQLLNENNQNVSLSDYRGRWLVLHFFPADDTPSCTCDSNEFTVLLTRLRDMNAAIVGISPDTPVNHRYHRDKYGLKLTLLSDPQYEAMTQYGAVLTMQVAGAPIHRVLRSTFIIDPKGNIAWHWPEAARKNHARHVAAKLGQLRSSAN